LGFIFLRGYSPNLPSFRQLTALIQIGELFNIFWWRNVLFSHINGGARAQEKNSQENKAELLE
jgi:hypothetical protein